MKLEERDLHFYDDVKTGTQVYTLDVPRIKKRQIDRDTKQRRISQETGRVLYELIEQNRKQFGGAQDSNRPIFCRRSPRAIAFADAAMNRFAYHWTCPEFSNAVADFGDKNELRTPGAGDRRFRIFPRRLRYTFATRLAVEGAPPRVIAEALDHTDLQNVQVYIETAGKMAERLTSALGPSLRPITERFLGRMIAGPEEAGEATKPIPARLSSKMMGHIGSCGGHTCMEVPPLACYRCRYFSPWRMADHEGLLETVVEFRELIVRGMATPYSLDIVDQAISGIKSVIEAKAAMGAP